MARTSLLWPLASLLALPLLVSRGEPVTIVARAGAVVATAPGTAMQDGQRGQRIRVRNLQSNKVQTATVVGSGQVEVSQ